MAIALPRPLHGLGNEGAPLPRRGKDELASSVRNLIPQFCLIRSRSRALASGDIDVPRKLLSLALASGTLVSTVLGGTTNFLVSAVVAAGGEDICCATPFFFPIAVSLSSEIVTAASDWLG